MSEVLSMTTCHMMLTLFHSCKPKESVLTCRICMQNCNVAACMHMCWAMFSPGKLHSQTSPSSNCFLGWSAKLRKQPWKEFKSAKVSVSLTAWPHASGGGSELAISRDLPHLTSYTHIYIWVTHLHKPSR